MAKVTVTFEDNPMRGMPGQNDINMTMSAEPSIPLLADQPDVDSEEFTDAMAAALTAVMHVTGLASSALMVVLGADEN